MNFSTPVHMNTCLVCLWMFCEGFMSPGQLSNFSNVMDVYSFLLLKAKASLFVE